ncbi:family 4 glycosyl hydrolase [Roseibium marinum]|uniref:Alpha-galactosidase n=1 Tax=Roseibium marinum TaxID=281252 RepID=A0A2S3UJK8_9HYPH|nr:alpha-galactosidase [Roseibium marinum]POF27877.1 alpha-galactosidase [Roseibium marinum]
MKYSEYGTPVKIAYIGGGSLNWALNLMSDLAHDTRLAAEVRLFDIDRAAADRNERIGARFAGVSRGTPARYRTVARIEDALDQADVVVISILPGRFADMANDIEIPAGYGIPQAVGDTVGPGGFVRALRAVPIFLEIGKAIRDHAPNAFVCNLTNPMSVLTGALYRTFPDIKCWGECHEVTKIRKLAAWIANREAGETRWDFRDIDVNVLGINHFTFVDRITLADRDLMPAYRKFAADHADAGWREREPAPDDEHARYFEDRNRVKFDLLNRFGIAAAAGDRHLAEFLPAGDYLKSHAAWGFTLTPVDFRIRYQEQKRARAEDLASAKAEPRAVRSDEALIDQIAALMGQGKHVSNVNLPNRGQLEGLDLDAIVETNAVFLEGEITPINAGGLPPELEKIVLDHSRRQMGLLTALAEGNYRSLAPLFCSDPLVRDLTERDAHAMFQEMISSTAHLLPSRLAAEAA